MGHKLAIDFGTTNSLIARWDDESGSAQVLPLPGLSIPPDDTSPVIIPSLIYVKDGQAPDLIAGYAVREAGATGKRLFSNFKRGIVASPAPPPRQLDGVPWADVDAGEHFIHAMLTALPHSLEDIGQLVVTVPVAAFQGYLDWLNHVFDDVAAEKIRIVDESTAAALGYAVTEPGATVLVFDFGGGTLDVSMVQLPESRERTGGFLKRLLRLNASEHSAQVIAKAGRVIGGSDIDQWLLTTALNRLGLHDVGEDYTALLQICEQAKIALSTEESTELTFKDHTLTVTRAELESLLEENGFYAALRRVVDKVMHVARQRGIFKEDINYVLMVGGLSLMPSVQETLREYFHETAIRADKPFTAIVEGALQVAAGYGLDDYLVHSYGIRYLDGNGHQYDEIIPMGSQIPLARPVEVVMGAAHQKQEFIEFVIGEIDTDAATMIEVQHEDGQAVFVAKTEGGAEHIIPLNAEQPPTVRLKPRGTAGEDRVKAVFTVDERRQLRVTVTDLRRKKTLLNDTVITTLR